MKSLLKKRLPGILAVGMVTLAVGAAGVAPAAASDASVSGLTAKQKRAKAKALKACKKKRKAKQRRTCTKRVKKRYARLAKRKPPKAGNGGGKGQTYKVYVKDNYYDWPSSPSPMKIKVNDFISWDWSNVAGSEAHNVSLFNGPAGVSPYDFESTLSRDPNYRFTAQFTKPGSYDFVCSLHTQMRMSVQVTR